MKRLTKKAFRGFFCPSGPHLSCFAALTARSRRSTTTPGSSQRRSGESSRKCWWPRPYDTKQDLVIVTTADSGGKSAREYADDFYDEHGFGYEGEYGSGALFLIDMDNREYYISTAGSAIGLYSDDEIDDTLDALYDDMRDGNYGEACRDFVLEARAAVLGDAELKDSYFDREEGRFVTVPEWKKNLSPSHLLAYFATALVISAVVVWIAARKRKTRMTVTGAPI